MYLSTGEIIETRLSEQSTRFLPRRTEAVYQAVTRACASRTSGPAPGRSAFCAFKAWCLLAGATRAAAVEAPLAFAMPGSPPVPPAARSGLGVTATPEGFDPAHLLRLQHRPVRHHRRCRLRSPGAHRAVDRVFYVASALADWSLIWHAIGLTQAVADRRRVPDMVRSPSGSAWRAWRSTRA